MPYTVLTVINLDIMVVLLYSLDGNVPSMTTLLLGELYKLFQCQSVELSKIVAIFLKRSQLPEHHVLLAQMFCQRKATMVWQPSEALWHHSVCLDT